MIITVSTLLFAAFLIVSIAVAAASIMNTYTRVPQTVITRLQKKVRDDGGRSVNVCLAIDGSSCVSAAGFDTEKQFVLDIVSIICVDEQVGFAATQFALSNSPIRRLTFDSTDFTIRLKDARSLNGGPVQIGGGVLYYINALRQNKVAANKMVFSRLQRR